MFAHGYLGTSDQRHKPEEVPLGIFGRTLRQRVVELNLFPANIMDLQAAYSYQNHLHRENSSDQPLTPVA